MVPTLIINKVREYRELRMREAKDSSQWTQEALGRLVGVTRQTMISIEKGTYNPSLELALKRARALSVKLEELFESRSGEHEN